MRRLAAKQNVDSPTGDFPYGRINDDNGTGIGTPVDEAVYGDFHQFFERMMNEAGIVPNGMADSEYTGFQLFEALLQAVSKRVGKYSFGDSLLESSTNFNDYKNAGSFEATSSFTNKPTNLGATAQLLVSGHGSSVTQRLVDLTDGAEWKRTYNGSSWTAWTLIRCASVRVDIGDWDMNADAFVNVPHSLGSNYLNIKSITGMIRNDANTVLYVIGSDGVMFHPLTGLSPTGTPGVDATDITLVRLASSIFDDVAFDSTGFNRGWLNIEYEK